MDRVIGRRLAAGAAVLLALVTCRVAHVVPEQCAGCRSRRETVELGLFVVRRGLAVMATDPVVVPSATFGEVLRGTGHTHAWEVTHHERWIGVIDTGPPCVPPPARFRGPLSFVLENSRDWRVRVRACVEDGTLSLEDMESALAWFPLRDDATSSASGRTHEAVWARLTARYGEEPGFEPEFIPRR